MRVEDYGKVAATFLDVRTGLAIRVAPRLDIRDRACAFMPDEPRRYFAQMQAYQWMPDEEMLTLQEVMLNVPVQDLVSRPGLRVNCDVCGEEIMNEREIYRDGSTLCQGCAGAGYYRSILAYDLKVSLVTR
jgi:formylmethanofuran dehydrogenase subunit E